MTGAAGTDGAFVPLGPPRSQTELATEAIRGAILAGRIEPGELLVERRLAESLGISKTPVREALIVLTHTGLVQVTRNRGVAVRELTLADARHIYEQRLLLEPWAVARACANPDAQLDDARLRLREAEALVDDPSQGLALANRHFHRALYVGCPNDLVVDTLDRLQDLAALAVFQVFWEISPTWREEMEEHREILAAAAARDSDTVQRLMHEHIDLSLRRLTERDDSTRD